MGHQKQPTKSDQFTGIHKTWNDSDVFCTKFHLYIKIVTGMRRVIHTYHP
ncbi:hypothetical protein Hanom_Chr08g00744851 [Helianthus anomalus]